MRKTASIKSNQQLDKNEKFKEKRNYARDHAPKSQTENKRNPDQCNKEKENVNETS